MGLDRCERRPRLDGASGRSSRRTLVQATAGAMATFAAARLPLAAAFAQDGTPCPETTTEEALAIAEAYFAAFNAGDADALGALLAPDYRHEGALVNEQDREIHMERLRTNRAAFPDGHYELSDSFANGDLVAIRHVFTGTLQGPYAGVEPAGQPVAVRGVHIHRIACGQIVETWNSGDALGLLRQIGALPSPGASPRTPLEQQSTPAAASPAADCPPGTAEESFDIARRWTEEALDTHTLDVLDEFVAPDLIHHAGIFVDEIGRDALKEDFVALLTALPDSRWSADVIVATDDRAAVRWTGRGTHEGEFQGLAPTGLPVVLTGINVYRIDCGQIVEGWSEPDSLGFLQQLGVVPEVNPTGDATPTS
ncbi:MAG: ester cyclase [Thermomicrobiales bacterium]